MALLIVACSSAASAPKPAPPLQKPALDAGVERAKTIFDAQLASLRKGGDNDGFLATFADDAVVLVPDARPVKDKQLALHDAIDYVADGDSAKVVVGTMAVGGNASAVWFNATIDVTGTRTRTVRVTELAVAPSWKVVAAAFTDTRTLIGMSSGRGSIEGATKAGPLSQLLASPTALDAAIAKDPALAVFGTDKKESAFGAVAAHKLVATWTKRKLSIEGTPREVTDKDWGFVQAHVNWDQGEAGDLARLTALVIGVPTKDGWEVVAVNFGVL